MQLTAACRKWMRLSNGKVPAHGVRGAAVHVRGRFAHSAALIEVEFAESSSELLLLCLGQKAHQHRTIPHERIPAVLTLLGRQRKQS